MKILIVGGARPNYMKIAPLVHALKKKGRGIRWRLVDTGQHYDYELSRVFFEEFDIPRPHYFLHAGSGSHAEQTAKILVEFEKVCLEEQPDWVIVVGDVNSTLACAVTAKKMGIKIAHVEAGLRSFDMTMPEEINRIVTDSISDILFVSERSGLKNLANEGIGCKAESERSGSKNGKRQATVYFVGNVMIDTLHYSLKKLKAWEKKGRSPNLPVTQSLPQEIVRGKYAVLTLHRPANVDNKDKLLGILKAIARISADMPVYFPCHPRTAKNIERFMLKKWIGKTGIHLLPPLSYLSFLSLWKDAALVLTDSGGIQEETTALGIPCFTIRDNTERPVTIHEGTNILVGTCGSGILSAYARFRSQKYRKRRVPEYWDGRCAARIVAHLIARAR